MLPPAPCLPGNYGWVKSHLAQPVPTCLSGCHDQATFSPPNQHWKAVCAKDGSPDRAILHHHQRSFLHTCTLVTLEFTSKFQIKTGQLLIWNLLVNSRVTRVHACRKLRAQSRAWPPLSIGTETLSGIY